MSKYLFQDRISGFQIVGIYATSQELAEQEYDCLVLEGYLKTRIGLTTITLIN